MIEFKNEGVYVIVNEVNNRIYIGSSINLGNRKSKHFALLTHNKHSNHLLQTDFNQFGIDSFNFMVLKYCRTELRKEEQYFFNELRPYYNITKDAIKNIPSKSSRKKMSITRKKLMKEGVIEPTNCKIVIQKNLNDEFIQEYESINDAARQIGIHPTSIQRVLKGTYEQSNGFKFYYKI